MSNEYYDEKRRKRKSEIIKGLVFLVAFFAILYGYFIPVVVYESSGPIEYYTDVIGRKNSPKLSGTVYLKNVPIYLEGTAGITTLTQYDLDQWTNEIPDALLQNCTGIYICDKGTDSTCDKVFASADWSNAYTQDPAAFVIGNEYNVYSFSNNKKNIIHELMHLYTKANGLENSQQVIDLYNSYNSYFRDLASFDASEFLSVVSENYFMNPKSLQNSELQPVYDYFQSLFHYYA